MPRDVNMRKNFKEQFGEKAQAKKPKAKAKKPKKKKRQTFKEAFGDRAKRTYIATAANELKHIVITYRKITTGEVKQYLVAPYSYRFRRNKKGSRLKALYAYDADDKKIKSFYIRNIKTVAQSPKSFKPMWAVELG